jgi:hypothetical protein
VVPNIATIFGNASFNRVGDVSRPLAGMPAGGASGEALMVMQHRPFRRERTTK